MTKTPARLVIPLLAAILVHGCTTHQSFVVQPRGALGVVPEGPFSTYRIAVTYIAQDDTGVPQETRDIEAMARLGFHNGKLYCLWEDYNIRSYRTAEEAPLWSAYEPAVGFEYVMERIEQDPDYLDNLPNVDSIPRDMDGFYFYINLIDLHMWDLYINLFLNTRMVFPEMNLDPLAKIGDTLFVDLRSLPIGLLEWENLTSDLTMSAGEIRAEYLAENLVGDTRVKVIFFQQDQTISQVIYGVGMKMPYRGTNRFLGHLYVDEQNRLIKAHYREFVYGKVQAPMGQTVITHSERLYSIELVAIQ